MCCVQERSEQQEVEVSRLHGLLQTTQPVAPGGVPLGGQRDEPREAGDSDHVSSEGCTTSTPPHTRRVTRKRRRAKSLAGRYKKTKTIKKENGLPSGTKLGQVIPPAPSASEELRSVDMKDNDVASSRECHMVASTEETTKRGSDREPSPEIPLQSQAKRVSSPTNLLDNLTELEGRGCGKIEESKPSEEVVTSLTELPRVGSEVERVAKCRESSVVAAEASQLKVGHEHAGAAGEREKHGAGVSMVKAAGRRRTTILSRKSQGPHLSVVEEVGAGGCLHTCTPEGALITVSLL